MRGNEDNTQLLFCKNGWFCTRETYIGRTKFLWSPGQAWLALVGQLTSEGQ